jgi:Flp pilus assembly protein TadG
MVEFCIVLPFLLILLVGMIEFSLLLYDQQVITNCSRECARTGIVATTPRNATTVSTAINTVKPRYNDKLITFGATDTLTVTPDMTAGTNFGNPLTVTVTYNYTFLVLPNFITMGESLTLRSITVMNFE